MLKLEAACTLSHTLLPGSKTHSLIFIMWIILNETAIMPMVKL